MRRPWLCAIVAIGFAIIAFNWWQWANRVGFKQFLAQRQATLRLAAAGLTKYCADNGTLPATLNDCINHGLFPGTTATPDQPAWNITGQVYRPLPTTCPTVPVLLFVETYDGGMPETSLVFSDGTVEATTVVDRVLMEDDRLRALCSSQPASIERVGRDSL